MNEKLFTNLKEHKAPSERLPVKYIITSSIEIVNSQEILFVSFFSQEKLKEKADFKVYIYENEYISQKLQKDGTYKWSNACVENLIGYWNTWNSLIGACNTSTEKENIAIFLNADLKEPGDEYRAIVRFQEKVMRGRLKARHDVIKKKIDDVMDKVPGLPSDFKKWIYNVPFSFSRYIYYKREGKKINAFCTECKKEFAIQETNITKKNIKHNNKGTCPKCKRKITYKAIGKTTHLSDRCSFSIIQKYEDSIIVRYFSGTKSYDSHYKHPSLHYWEKVRKIYFFKEGKIEIKKYEYAEFLQTGEHRWCNDNYKYETSKAPLYTRNLRTVLKGTKWQYCCLYEFAKKVKILYPGTFLKEYINHPSIEYLIKLKLYNFVDNHLNSHYYVNWDGVNFKGKSIKDVLGIDKALLQQMQRLDLGCSGMNLIKKASEKGKVLDDSQVKWITSNVDSVDFVNILDYSTPCKIINYIKKQTNKEYSAENVLIDWCDYIQQCKELKFDINNSFVLYPKNLKERHEEYSIMNKSKGFKKYDLKVAKAFKKLNELYSYSDNKFSIRPANSVNEIVAEGHRQRHCVGGNTYIGGVANGTTAIMLLRKLDSSDTPLYTVELNLKSLEVRQCRGYKNCDMTEEVKKFIDKWKLKKLTIKSTKKVV